MEDPNAKRSQNKKVVVELRKEGGELSENS